MIWRFLWTLVASDSVASDSVASQFPGLAKVKTRNYIVGEFDLLSMGSKGSLALARLLLQSSMLHAHIYRVTKCFQLA